MINALIVDDQYPIIEGMLSGIHWQQLEIDNVFTASNATRAQEILENYPIDIVLCDIEMPQEDGLSLFTRSKSAGNTSVWIFLTSHSDFSYIQAAIRQGAFDYIVQPAMYTDIEAVLRRAVTTVHQKRSNQHLYHIGAILDQQREKIAAEAFRSHLLGNRELSSIGTFAQLKLLPEMQDTGAAVMLCTDVADAACTGKSRILQEAALTTFQISPYQIAVCEILPGCYELFLQITSEFCMQSLRTHLTNLTSLLSRDWHCHVFVFCEQKCEFENLPAVWSRLSFMRARYGKTPVQDILMVDEDIPPEQVEIASHSIRWNRMLREGLYGTVLQDIHQLLNKLQDEKCSDRVTLHQIYQEFMRVLNDFASTGTRHPLSVFHASQLYQTSPASTEEMEALVAYAIEILQSQHPTTNDNDIVVQVKQYVSTHLESEITCEEIAHAVYLHPDYLTKLFKNRTGMTLKSYITNQKNLEAQILIRTTNLPVSFVAAKLGYTNFSHFSTVYKKATGISPSADRSLCK